MRRPFQQTVFPIAATRQHLVRIDRRYFRLSEIDLPLGAPNTANAPLGWHYKVRFPELFKEIVADDPALLTREGWRCTFNE